MVKRPSHRPSTFHIHRFFRHSSQPTSVPFVLSDSSIVQVGRVRVDMGNTRVEAVGCIDQRCCPSVKRLSHVLSSEWTHLKRIHLHRDNFTGCSFRNSSLFIPNFVASFNSGK